MPITSHQVSGMIGGQQAMFGNFASYSQQISPGGGQGPMPTYSNPMQGAGITPASPLWDRDQDVGDFGPRAMSAVGNIGLPALGTAAMIGGSFLPGMAGRALGSMDPFSAGLGGFARGAGLRSGGAGVMSNLGRIASGGIGSIARAGMAGVGGAMAAAAAPLAIGGAASYGVGQMVQGAQFNNQVGNTLQQQFRFSNQQSETGFGFSRQQQGGIGDMLRDMGHKDIMSSPQELLNIMKQGSQMGVFRATQDVTEFKKRFTEMVGTLKTISKEMNTTLEGAMPFFQQARQQGFWTPSDITNNAQMARKAAGATGMSVAQAQQMMGQGAGMARQVGAMGWTGAQGMAQSMGVVGGALRSGVLSESQLSEMTGGLQGQEAIQAEAGQQQAATTRFASGRVGRWMLASLGGKGFKSLDSQKVASMMSGNMGVGAIAGGARQNIGREGAFNFVMNEEKLRGELIKRGPELQAGMVRSLAGKHLYDDSAKGQYITRRVIKRFFGGSSQQADARAKMAREMPQIMRDNEARSASESDQLARNRDELMDQSWEGMKRQAAKWWDREVKGPLQQFGAEVGRSISRTYEKASDSFWGRASMRNKLRGISKEGMGALQTAALGNSREMETQFATSGQMEQKYGAQNTGMGLVGGGVQSAWRGQSGFLAGAQNWMGGAFGTEEATNKRIEGLRKMGVSETMFNSEDERRKGNREQGLVSGAYRGRGFGAGGEYRSMSVADIEKAQQGLSASVTGKVTARSAAALGFQNEVVAAQAIKEAQKEMSSGSYQLAAARLAHTTQKSGWELGEAAVTAISQGKLGSANLRKFVMGGKNMQERVFRLSTAQSDEQRGGYGGVGLGDLAKDIGAGTMGGIVRTTEQLDEAFKKAEGSLADALSTATATTGGGSRLGGMSTLRRTGVTPDTIAQLREKPEFREITRLMASEPTDPEEHKVWAEKLSALNGKLAMSKLPADQREALMRMTNPNDPGYKAAKEQLKSLGGLEKEKATTEFWQTIKTRRERFKTNLGDQKEKLFDAMDKVGTGGRSMGAIVRELVNNTDMDPREYQKKIHELVASTGQADPKAAAAVQELLRQQPGAEDISAAVTGGMAVAEMSKRTSKGGLADPGRAAQALHMATGMKLNAKDMKDLTGSDRKAADKVKERLTQGLEGSDKSNKEGILDAIRDKEPSKLLTLMQKRATANAIGQLSDPQQNLLLAAKNAMRGDKGVLNDAAAGSPKSLWTVGMAQITLLREVIEAVKENKPGTVPEPPKKGG